MFKKYNVSKIDAVLELADDTVCNEDKKGEYKIGRSKKLVVDKEFLEEKEKKLKVRE